MASSTKEDILKYENLINNVLKADLKRFQDELAHANSKIDELNEQLNTLNTITDKKCYPNGFKAQVNLGSNFFMEATVPDTSTVLIDIGKKIYLEFSTKEGIEYTEKMLNEYIKYSKRVLAKVSATSAHIKLMLMLISQIEEENN